MELDSEYVDSEVADYVTADSEPTDSEPVDSEPADSELPDFPAALEPDSSLVDYAEFENYLLLAAAARRFG